MLTFALNDYYLFNPNIIASNKKNIKNLNPDLWQDYTRNNLTYVQYKLAQIIPDLVAQENFNRSQHPNSYIFIIKGRHLAITVVSQLLELRQKPNLFILPLQFSLYRNITLDPGYSNEQALEYLLTKPQDNNCEYRIEIYNPC